MLETGKFYCREKNEEGEEKMNQQLIDKMKEIVEKRDSLLESAGRERAIYNFALTKFAEGMKEERESKCWMPEGYKSHCQRLGCPDGACKNQDNCHAYHSFPTNEQLDELLKEEEDA